MKEDIRSNT